MNNAKELDEVTASRFESRRLFMDGNEVVDAFENKVDVCTWYA